MKKCLLAICFNLVFLPFAIAQVRYNVTDLGTLGGGSTSQAFSINSTGDIVGDSWLPGTAGSIHAFLWTASKGMQDIGSLGGTPDIACAYSINSSQQVTGYSDAPDGYSHAFYWSQATGMVDIGTIDGSVGDSVGNSINAAGEVAGTSSVADGHNHGFIWTSAGGFQDLGVPANETDFYAQAIDDLGRVVGAGSSYPYDTTDAFIWTKNGGFQNLGKLKGGTSAYALAIDDKGAVTGYANVTNTTEYPHAFLWSKTSGMRDLGTLTGGNSAQSYGYGIALNGQIVGGSSTGGFLATIYTKSRGMQNLNALTNLGGWTLYWANGVNLSGQIVGYGGINAQGHAFLLTPQ